MLFGMARSWFAKGNIASGGFLVRVGVIAIALAALHPSAAGATPSFSQVRAVLAIALDSAASAFSPFGVPAGTTGIAEYGVRGDGPTSPPNDFPKMPAQIRDACPDCDITVTFYQHQAGHEDPALWDLRIANGGDEGDVTFDQAQAFILSSLGGAIPKTWNFAKTLTADDPQQLTMFWVGPDGALLSITYATPSASFHPELDIEVKVPGHCPISCDWTPPN